MNRTAAVITAMSGVSNVRQGNFISAVFECDYSFAGRVTVVRISKDLETITIEQLGDEAAESSIKLQKFLPDRPLHAIDMDFSFKFELSRFGSGDELRVAIEQG